MQTSRRRSHGAGLTSKNRLVTGRVRFIAAPIHIRWQRHGATSINIDILVERDDPLPLCRDFLNAQADTVDRCRRAHAHFAARVDHAFPTRWPKTPEEQE